jgi:hypothetical protein
MVLRWTRPLQAPGLQPRVRHAAAGRPDPSNLLPDLIRMFVLECVAVPHRRGDGTDDRPVWPGLPDGVDRTPNALDPPLGIHECAVLLER